MTNAKAVEEPKEERKNDYCRKVRISNYRNIGVGKPAYMTINRSLDSNRLGGLSIIVGPNNSGKSNVLDAVEALDKGISADDNPDFFSIECSESPEVKISVFDDGEVIMSSKNINRKKPVKVSNDRDYEGEFVIQANRFLQEIMSSSNKEIKEVYSKNKLKIDNLYPVSYDSMGIVALIVDISNQISPLLMDEIFQKGDYGILEKMVNEVYADPKKIEAESQKSSFEEKYGFSPYPTIVRYKEEPIRDSDLRSKVRPFNSFMQNVLGMTFNNTGIKKVADIYEKFNNGGSSGYLTRAEKELQKDVDEFAKRFNDLYYTSGLPYSFNIRLMEETITFEIYMGDEPQNLDRQSTGFKWFFNFFFNFLCSRSLKPGDIVIMDEPATNLHPSGQMELREFIRKFAINTGVSFIISTHSPFLIDCDYLDELRIVSRLDDGTSTIYDKFTVVDNENPDQMNQILKSLTIGRHVLMDPNERLYFVEGITDYNYLTAFKLYFGIKGISFMPINGLGGEEDKTHREAIITSLMKIDRSPTLIVDGDGAGDEMKEMAKGTGLEVLSLKDINPKYHSIENLFKREDRDKFIPVKEWHASSIFKQYIDEIGPQLSDYTIDNFKKLFKALEV